MQEAGQVEKLILAQGIPSADGDADIAVEARILAYGGAFAQGLGTRLRLRVRRLAGPLQQSRSILLRLFHPQGVGCGAW